jgi:hypothetical protein
MVDAVEPKDWPAEPFTPTAVQVVMVLGVIVAGFFISMGIAHLGGSKGRGKAG